MKVFGALLFLGVLTNAVDVDFALRLRRNKDAVASLQHSAVAVKEDCTSKYASYSNPCFLASGRQGRVFVATVGSVKKALKFVGASLEATIYTGVSAAEIEYAWSSTAGPKPFVVEVAAGAVCDAGPPFSGGWATKCEGSDDNPPDLHTSPMQLNVIELMNPVNWAFWMDEHPLTLDQARHFLYTIAFMQHAANKKVGGACQGDFHAGNIFLRASDSAYKLTGAGKVRYVNAKVMGGFVPVLADFDQGYCKTCFSLKVKQSEIAGCMKNDRENFVGANKKPFTLFWKTKLKQDEATVEAWQKKFEVVNAKYKDVTDNTAFWAEILGLDIFDPLNTAIDNAVEVAETGN
jgi:hypothetical protein